ncbi:MAG TPA: glycosyltransferase [Flavisolibacter sp.]|nr:glycosyltransferase [Flavisolibacter sp.]
MTLSIIIINYNVKYFLEQCLYSVVKAIEEAEAEIIVVDNHSTDESLPYLCPKFPQVRFIQNGTNSGFGKACNRGLREASGEYVLFLNPDTIVAEDSFTQCIRFFETHPGCGALGVKMIDGSGAFLKESKRAFPSPQTSLFKLAGLSYLFPHSKVFSRYHLGHLNKEQSHEVDVLAGAFLMTKKEILLNVGAFDEAFFMYGEDVDLSYRIQKAGYKNYYFAGTTIIHFKGESTRRGSLNYVRMFYQAMITFVRKHYGGVRAGIFNFSIQLAIWIRALMAALLKLVKWIGIPVIDAFIILLSFYMVKEMWVRFVRTDIVYPGRLLLVSFPLFTLVYLTAAYYAGLYDRYFRLRSLLRSTLIATVTLLTVYALLPEAFRFSRAIVMLGAVVAFVFITLQRWALVKAGILFAPVTASSKPYMLIAGNGKEYSEVKKFLSEKGFKDRIIGRVSINGTTDNAVAHITDINATAGALGARELVFCARTLSYKRIIALTEERHQSGLKFRFHAAGSTSIVGSDTSTDSGEILSAETDFNLSKAAARRAKRLIDGAVSLFFILTFPFHFFGVKKPLRFFANCFAVLFAKKTWAGYLVGKPFLPPLRKGVLAPNGPKSTSQKLSEQNIELLDYWYARNYEAAQDLKTIFTHYRYLGSE